MVSGIYTTVSVGWTTSNGKWAIDHPVTRRFYAKSIARTPVPHSTRMRHRQLKRARRLAERERRRGIL